MYGVFNSPINSINNKKINIPIISGESSFVYDGTQKSPTVIYDNTKIVVTLNPSAVEIGEYTIRYELLDPVNTTWIDNTTAPKYIYWSIISNE